MKLRLNFSSSSHSQKEISFQREFSLGDYYSLPRDEEIFLEWLDLDSNEELINKTYKGFVILSLSRDCNEDCHLGDLAKGERGNFFTVRAEEGHKVEAGSNYNESFVRITSAKFLPIPITFRMLGWMHQHCVCKVILHVYFSVNELNFCQEIVCRPYKITPHYEDY